VFPPICGVQHQVSESLESIFFCLKKKAHLRPVLSYIFHDAQLALAAL
jgi:hypothetical protein